MDGTPQTIVEMQSLVGDACGTKTCYVGNTAYIVIGTVTIGGAKSVISSTTMLPAPALVATPTVPADSPPVSTPDEKPDTTPDAMPAATPAATPVVNPGTSNFLLQCDVPAELELSRGVSRAVTLVGSDRQISRGFS